MPCLICHKFLHIVLPCPHRWLEVCRGVLQEMESVVTRARHFQFKPDGDVTFMMAQDAVGLPAPVMQACLSGIYISHPATVDAHLQT